MTKRKKHKRHFMDHGTSEEDYQKDRLEKGIDPDEHTIYNVLCPKIRERWSLKEECKRRMKPFRVETQEVAFLGPLQETYTYKDFR